MRLLIIRHAVAVERGTQGIPDDERPLTPAGERRFKKAARGLRRVAPRPDAILSSPLPRAWRTAEIAAAAFGRLAPEKTPALVDGSLTDLARALAPYGAESTVALVGHEPQLSGFLAELLGSRAAERLTFRKGGAALVEVPADLAGGGTLLWFLTPKLLRGFAE
jgi:phosphohistidine phosphatase